MIKKIDHLVITTKNIEKCQNFYQALGFSFRQSAGRCELYTGDFKINVHIFGKELLPKAAFVTPGSGDLCFEVNEPLSSVREKILSQGIEIEVDTVHREGVRGSMLSLYLRDPDGNLIELSSYIQ